MHKKLASSVLALGMVSAMLLSGCTAATSEARGEGAANNTSASPVEKLSAIDKVRKADPDNISENLVYKSIGENSKGKYVVLGANPKSKSAKFDPELWTDTGDNWTKAEMAQMQLDAIDFLYASMLSGPGVGGNDADRKKQADETLKKFDKASLANGGEESIRSVFNGPDANNPFLISTDPAASQFIGYEIFQDENSSRYLNPKAALNTARSYNKGFKGEQGVATADIATVDVSALADKKLVKDGDTYTMRVYVDFAFDFVKADGEVKMTGVNSMGSDFSAATEKVKF